MEVSYLNILENLIKWRILHLFLADILNHAKWVKFAHKWNYQPYCSIKTTFLSILCHTHTSNRYLFWCTPLDYKLAFLCIKKKSDCFGRIKKHVHMEYYIPYTMHNISVYGVGRNDVYYSLFKLIVAQAKFYEVITLFYNPWLC